MSYERKPKYILQCIFETNPTYRGKKKLIHSKNGPNNYMCNFLKHLYFLKTLLKN